MVLNRNSLKYIINYYLPSGLFVLVSWVSFLIPPEIVPGRMTLLVTIFLVLINIFNNVTSNSPNVEGLTAISSNLIQFEIDYQFVCKSFLSLDYNLYSFCVWSTVWLCWTSVQEEPVNKSRSFGRKVIKKIWENFVVFFPIKCFLHISDHKRLVTGMAMSCHLLTAFLSLHFPAALHVSICSIGQSFFHQSNYD